MSKIETNSIMGVSGEGSSPITLSGNTATLGSGSTVSGTIAADATIASNSNMPDFSYNLSMGEKRIINISDTSFIVYGSVASAGSGNSSARTGIYGSSSPTSVSGIRTQLMGGYIGKLGNRGDMAQVLSRFNDLSIRDRVQGYAMGPSSNAIGSGTLSPSVNRWSAQFNSSEDYELQLAVGEGTDSGAFYYWIQGVRAE